MQAARKVVSFRSKRSNEGDKDTDQREDWKLNVDERWWGSITMETLVQKKGSLNNGRAMLHEPRLMMWKCEGDGDENKQNNPPSHSVFGIPFMKVLYRSLYKSVTAEGRTIQRKSQGWKLMCLQVYRFSSRMSHGSLSWFGSFKAAQQHTSSSGFAAHCVCLCECK